MISCLVVLYMHFVVGWSILGNVCNDDSHCNEMEHCAGHKCRAAFCNSNNDCTPGEVCKERISMQQKACYEGTSAQSTELCPGGQPIVVNQFTGEIRRCDANTKSCPGKELCNPKNGYCCLPLRTCRRPMRPEIDAFTVKPKFCMNGESEIKGVCGIGSICETDSGFCCTLPQLNQECSAHYGCSTPNSQCACDSSQSCTCKCLDFLGYSPSTDGRTCQRARRRLSEQCQTSAECKSAFVECRSSKCQCRSGFVADTNGGCQPVEYRCGSNLDMPYVTDSKLFICEKHIDTSKYVARRPDGSSTSWFSRRSSECARKERYMVDSCPDNYYCVPFYDVPQSPQHYKGFCCKRPENPPSPRCPVGQPHPSSQSPAFGCDNCPATNYYCHEDPRTTSLEICCPKACINPDDVYVDGQCYPVSSYGQQCEINGQCVGRQLPDPDNSDAAITTGFGQKMQCVDAKCSCTRGFIEMSARCVRAICTVGLQSEPLTGSDGKTLRCTSDASNICPQGYQCDPTFGVCCKRWNRCPHPYTESSYMCGNGSGCPPNQICYFTQANQVTIGVCCQGPWWGG